MRTVKWERCTFPSYAHIKGKLCIYCEILLHGSRIVVLKTLRDKVVRLAHKGHQGILKTKYRIRSKVWGPGMDIDVEQLCKVCHSCQVTSRYDPPEPMSRVLPPSAPLQDCSADLLGPLPKGDSILVLVDYFSRVPRSSKPFPLSLPNLVYHFLYKQTRDHNLCQESLRHFSVCTVLNIVRLRRMAGH